MTRLLLTLALLLWATTAQAAVTQTAANSAIANCSGTTGASFTITPSGSDRLLVIHESHFDPGETAVTTVTVDGSSTGVTLRQNVSVQGGAGEMNVFYLIAPAASTLTVAATYSANVSGDCVLGAVAYAGVHQGTPFGTVSVTGPQTSTTCVNSPSGGDAGGMVIQSVFGNGGTLSWSHTNRWEQESVLGGNASGGQQDTTGASATLTATLGSSANNACVADVIREAAAGGAACTGGLLLMGAGKC